MDLADTSTEITEIKTANAIAEVQRLAQIKLFPYTGKCYNCEASIPAHSFCDKECREDYEANKLRISRR
jgi:hypothetical protein